MNAATRVRRLRSFEPEDRESVLDLAVDAWASVFDSFESVLGSELFARIYPDWRAQQRQAVDRALDMNETWVSEEADDIVGFVNLRFDDDELTGEIHMIAVASDVQHQGIGTELTEFALAEMRHRGMTLATVASGADPGHTAARNTYENAGFTPFPQVWYSKLLEADGESE